MRKSLILALSVISTISFAGGPVATKAKPVSSKAISLPSFNGVTANGQLIITLKQGKTQGMTVSNPGLKHEQLKVFVDKTKTLHVSTVQASKSNNSTDYAPIKMTITAPAFHYLQANGQVTINGKNINTNSLILKALGQSSVDLNGQINIKSLTATNLANVNLAWVNSPKLILNADSAAQIKLAGVCDQLDAHLSAQAVANAQFLRTKNAWIQAKNNSVMKITPLDSLRGFAYNSSNIFYYQAPKFITRESKQSANILFLQS